MKAKKLSQAQIKRTLDAAWKQRAALRVTGGVLCARGGAGQTTGGALWAEGYALWARGNALLTKGNVLWAQAVLATIGSVTMRWVWRAEARAEACVLGNGMTFEPEGEP